MHILRHQQASDRSTRIKASIFLGGSDTFEAMQNNRFFPLILFPLTFFVLQLTAEEPKATESVLRAGMIGLDTSHATAFTKLFSTAVHCMSTRRIHIGTRTAPIATYLLHGGWN